MEKKKPKEQVEEEEKPTSESQAAEESNLGGFPDDVDFKRFLGCGG